MPRAAAIRRSIAPRATLESLGVGTYRAASCRTRRGRKANFRGRARPSCQRNRMAEASSWKRRRRDARLYGPPFPPTEVTVPSFDSFEQGMGMWPLPPVFLWAGQSANFVFDPNLLYREPQFSHYCNHRWSGVPNLCKSQRPFVQRRRWQRRSI